MTQVKVNDREALEEPKVRRRDWILLPFIGLLTVFLMALLAESIAWRVFPDTVATMHLTPCEVHLDTPVGARAVPNSVCWEQLAEGQLAQYKFNSCGDRAGVECGQKPPGTYRIVMIGTSVAVGRYVPREKTFAALLPAELSRLTGCNLDLYNEGMMQGYSVSTALRFNEILAAKPDMVLWILSPLDIEDAELELNKSVLPELPEAAGKPRSLKRGLYLLRTAYAANSFQEMLLKHFDRLRTALMLRHLLYESQSRYVENFLMGIDDADFLRTNPSPKFLSGLKQFDIDAAEAAARARVAGVPLVAVLVPNRAQAAMISMGEWPAGYDPFKLDDELRSIITSHGGIYIDILPGFRSFPNPEQYYYPVDGHPDADGHRIISGLLANALTDGGVPALKVAAQSNAAQHQGR